MNLALFDFDGTITTKDSLIEFIKYTVGKPKYYFGLFILSPMLTAYSLKIIPNHLAKEKLISYFFKNYDSREFQTISERYSLNEIDKITRPAAMEQILWHQEQGDTVAIVSASMESWLQAWCQVYKLTLISTRLEVHENKITGRFETKNCYGQEKASRVKEQFNLNDFDTIYAYGDSSGDKELLALAHKKHYKPFR